MESAKSVIRIKGPNKMVRFVGRIFVVKDKNCCQMENVKPVNHSPKLQMTAKIANQRLAIKGRSYRRMEPVQHVPTIRFRTQAMCKSA